MTMQSGEGTGSVGASFAEHVRQFHRSLPPEEQVLLEQVFALAGSAYQSMDDTEGHGMRMAWPSKYTGAGRQQAAGEGQQAQISADLQEVLLANLFGPR